MPKGSMYQYSTSTWALEPMYGLSRYLDPLGQDVASAFLFLCVYSCVCQNTAFERRKVGRGDFRALQLVFGL